MCLLMLTTMQQCWFCAICFSGLSACGYIVHVVSTMQHHSSLPIQVFEWVHTNKTELVVLNQSLHRRNDFHDCTAFWFHYWFKEVTSECESPIEKSWLPEKCYLNFTVVNGDVINYIPLTHVCCASLWGNGLRAHSTSLGHKSQMVS